MKPGNQGFAYITQSPVHTPLLSNLVVSLSLFQKCKRALCACLRAAILRWAENDLCSALGFTGKTNILNVGEKGKLFSICFSADFRYETFSSVLDTSHCIRVKAILSIRCSFCIDDISRTSITMTWNKIPH